MGGWYRQLERNVQGNVPLSNELFIKNSPERENAINIMYDIRKYEKLPAEQLFFGN